jgi:hypothetical protein
MSRAHTTTSRMMMTSAEHHDVVVVVGCDAAIEPPSTPYSPYYSINGSGDFLPPPAMQSATIQSYTGSRQTDLTHAGRREEHPPRLLPTKTIPLPALADIPISVNPVLSYTPSKIVLEYELSLPPSTARLPPTTKTHVGRWDWRRQPAMDPSTVGSMTIRVPGLERLVVVFPATLESTVITVDDVLIAVHRAHRRAPCCTGDGHGTPHRIWHKIWPEKDTGIESNDPSSLVSVRAHHHGQSGSEWRSLLVGGTVSMSKRAGCMGSAHKESQ